MRISGPIDQGQSYELLLKQLGQWGLDQSIQLGLATKQSTPSCLLSVCGDKAQVAQHLLFPM